MRNSLEEEKYYLASEIIRLARLITEEDDKPHYFSAVVTVNGKAVTLSTRPLDGGEDK